MKILLINLILFLASAGLAYQYRPKPTLEKSQSCQQKSYRETEKVSSIPASTKKTEPCVGNTISIFRSDSEKYPKDVLDEVSAMAKKLNVLLKINPKTEEEWKRHNRRLERLKNNGAYFKKKYPRFDLQEGSPNDYLNFGIHTGDYVDADQFLGKRVCSNPNLSIANGETSYLSLFFSLNQGRYFGGIIRIINERIVTLVEGNLLIDGNDEYFLYKEVPTASFKSWVHEDLERDYSGFVYQNHEIAQIRQDWDSNYFLGPWLYNACNKSVSTIHNNCSLDPSMDMELKDFYYITRNDLMIGNIFCKKSSDKSWTRLATLEFIRIR